jgi:hypothetical protein
MKLAIRFLVLSFVVVGAAAAATTPKAATVIPSHQAATDNMPGPGCGPHMGCPDPNQPSQPPSN